MADLNAKQIPNEPVYPKWYHERSRTVTGLIQFRSDVGDRTVDALGFVRRGEVRKVSETFADRAVEGGWFSHVAADTPLGQPDEYKPKPKAAKAEPLAPQEPQLGLREPESARVPIVITAEMRARLIDIGLTEKQINAMTPAQAHERLSAKG